MRTAAAGAKSCSPSALAWNQRSIAAPILGGGVGKKDFGEPVARRQAIEQAVGPPCRRVGLGCIVKRKEVAHARRTRRLSESLVEVAASLAAGNVDQQAVEYGALLFVLVQAEVKKLPQVPPALRRAEGVGMSDVGGAGVTPLDSAVPQERHCIPRRQQPQPDDRRTRGGIDHLVLLAWHEPRREIDMGRVGDYPTVV